MYQAIAPIVNFIGQGTLYILLAFAVLIALYTGARVVSMAVYNSKRVYDKQRHTKGEKVDGL
jgi:hypothetical protein